MNEVEIVDDKIVTESSLDNYSIDEIAEMCEQEKELSADSIPYENVRNNSKIFLIYLAKNQLKRVVKLSKYLENLEDRLIENSKEITDPDELMKIIGSIQSSMMTAINLIDKISTDDNYVKFVFNDNRKIINNVSNQIINSTNSINLSKESRDKLRNLAEDLLGKIESVEGGD